MNVTWNVTGSTIASQFSPNGFWSSLRIQGWSGPVGQDLFFRELSPFYLDVTSNPPAFWSPGSYSLTYTGSLWLTEDWVYQLNNDLSIGYSFVPGAQVSYTSAFNIDLPAGSQIISASGVLLSQAPGPAIPEPTSWALMMAGFGLTGAALRRRRHLHAVGHAA